MHTFTEKENASKFTPDLPLIYFFLPQTIIAIINTIIADTNTRVTKQKPTITSTEGPEK